MSKVYSATALIGGLAGALDKIDGAQLADGDAAVVITDSGVYHYHLDATSAATENSPFRIAPDANAGNKRWHLVGTTARIGALVKLSSNQSISTSTNTIVSWAAEIYDDANFWASSPNPTRLAVPVGVTRVIAKFCVALSANTSGRRNINIKKNGSFSYDGRPALLINAAVSGDNDMMVVSPVLAVTGGTDYFEANIYHSAGTSINAQAVNHTWFSIEAVAFG
jgi:hypothetical protein